MWSHECLISRDKKQPVNILITFDRTKFGNIPKRQPPTVDWCFLSRGKALYTVGDFSKLDITSSRKILVVVFLQPAETRHITWLTSAINITASKCLKANAKQGLSSHVLYMKIYPLNMGSTNALYAKWGTPLAGQQHLCLNDQLEGWTAFSSTPGVSESQHMT